MEKVGHKVGLKRIKVAPVNDKPTLRRGVA